MINSDENLMMVICEVMFIRKEGEFMQPGFFNKREVTGAFASLKGNRVKGVQQIFTSVDTRCDELLYVTSRKLKTLLGALFYLGSVEGTMVVEKRRTWGTFGR